jgi:hypothetical protein
VENPWTIYKIAYGFCFFVTSISGGVASKKESQKKCFKIYQCTVHADCNEFLCCLTIELHGRVRIVLFLSVKIPVFFLLPSEQQGCVSLHKYRGILHSIKIFSRIFLLQEAFSFTGQCCTVAICTLFTKDV